MLKNIRCFIINHNKIYANFLIHSRKDDKFWNYLSPLEFIYFVLFILFCFVLFYIKYSMQKPYREKTNIEWKLSSLLGPLFYQQHSLKSILSATTTKKSQHFFLSHFLILTSLALQLNLFLINVSVWDLQKKKQRFCQYADWYMKWTMYLFIKDMKTN